MTVPPIRGSSSNGPGCQAGSSSRSVSASQTRSGGWGSSRSNRSAGRPVWVLEDRVGLGHGSLLRFVEVAFEGAEAASPEAAGGVGPAQPLGEALRAQAVKPPQPFRTGLHPTRL